METTITNIAISYKSKKIDSILAVESKTDMFTNHYNQNEDFFIKLETEFIVPTFPIHHDSDKKSPETTYLNALEKLMTQIIPYTSSIFSNMTYFFDQTEIFHPCFYQVYKYKEQLYLYLIRLDLLFKPSDGTIIESGSNDVTNSYKTSHLYLESNLIPITGYSSENGIINGFNIEQNISDTWIGESGRGYLLEGIWMDLELTKYLSKLFLPKGMNSYPYYPFTCKYKTFCHTLANLSVEGRKKHLLYLHTAREYVLPLLNEIQEELKEESFSINLPSFIRMRQKVPEFWNKVWKDLNVKSYLNSKDMKEFLVEF
ncbi:MAG: hypothetical protein U9N32_09765 [Spirochaetota bacterium]|nr:hypothetical protein [Spirochaetota bacterium]